jgi:hypothetical protein
VGEVVFLSDTAGHCDLAVLLNEFPPDRGGRADFGPHAHRVGGFADEPDVEPVVGIPRGR